MLLGLIEKLRAAGTQPILVKGYSVSSYYAMPETRISGDADIYIAPELEKKALSVLAGEGFSINNSKKSHHIECQHPMIGTVEIHHSLFGKVSSEIWFDGKTKNLFTEKPIEVVTDDGSYLRLGYNDNLIYVTLHMLKHFISSGTSVRMMLDTALCYKEDKEKIDFDKYWALLGKLKMTTVVSAVLHSMKAYCGFKTEDFPNLPDCSENDIAAVMNDTESGGFLGQSDLSRNDLDNEEYNKYIMPAAKYNLRKIKSKIDYYFHAVFPGIQMLKSHYPILVHKVFLVPFFWLRWLARGLKRKLLKVKDKENTASSGKQRVEMFKQLGMLK